VHVADLRKKLNEGLRNDSSGKSTPIQRLTPFLQDLVTYLEEHDTDAQLEATIERIKASLQENPLDVLHRADGFPKVSSDVATQAAPAQTKRESDGASESAP
jgi:hypothetical protein